MGLMLWPWIGGLAAVFVEFYFRTHPSVPYWRQWIPALLGMVVNFAVFKIFTSASSLLAGFVAFSTATLIVRVFLSVAILREAVGGRTWAAVLLLVAAKFLMR